MLQVKYTGATTLQRGSVTGTPNIIISLDEGEQITGLFGREKDYIYQLGLTTNIRQYGPWGGDSGRKFTIQSNVIGFIGALRAGILSAIGVWGLIVTPQPPPPFSPPPAPQTSCTGRHSPLNIIS
jgi:hypothetical protein